MPTDRIRSSNGYSTHYGSSSSERPRQGSRTDTSRRSTSRNYDEGSGPPRSTRRSSSGPTSSSRTATSMRSVSQFGVLSQQEMRDRHMSYTPSHDGYDGGSSVALARVPGGPGLTDRERLDASHYAMHAPHFGAMTVAMEHRDHELGTQPLPLSPAQEAEIAAMPAEWQPVARNALSQGLGLSPAGLAEAERRMANTFMMTASNGSPPNQGSLSYETSASNIPPGSFNSMLVPPHLASQAHMVQMDMRRAGLPMPPVHMVPMQPMATPPDYHTQHGSQVTVPPGIGAPGYGNAIYGQTSAAGTDTHFVRVPPEYPPYR